MGVHGLPLYVVNPTVALADATSQNPVLKASLLDKLHAQGFSNETIARIFSDPRVELYPQILERRGKGINYFHKKFGLLTRKSVDRGRQVLSENNSFFKKLEGLYGVEKEAVVAIFRVETNLGSHTGNYPVLNSLLTMVTFPNRRSEWAEEELVRLLIICRNGGKDPLSINGSWAGAFGLCQFIPSSYMTYAVDGDGDNVIDLFNFSDAMASIAHYLKESGWQKSGAKKRKAIYAYNHCDDYVRAVMAYANACKDRPQKGRNKTPSTTTASETLLTNISCRAAIPFRHNRSTTAPAWHAMTELPRYIA
jgi:membrane-bound lytic murein transglycosylase B